MVCFQRNSILNVTANIYLENKNSLITCIIFDMLFLKWVNILCDIDSS